MEFLIGYFERSLSKGVERAKLEQVMSDQLGKSTDEISVMPIGDYIVHLEAYRQRMKDQKEALENSKKKK